MATLAQLTAAPRTDVYPGMILSPPTLVQIGLAEEHFRRTYIDTIADACTKLPSHVLERVMLKVCEDVKAYAMGFGGLHFDIWATSPVMGPYLTMLSLQVKHPQITLDEVRKTYADDPARADTILVGTLRLWGYLEPTAKNVGSQGSESPSLGTSSSDASPSPTPPSTDTPAAEVTPKSQA